MSFRLDRLITVYLTSPLKRMERDGSNGIPILMFHSISDRREIGRSAYHLTTTSPKAFKSQMEALYRAGYAAITLEQALAQMSAPRKTRIKQFVITFDDGYRDFYERAAPVLTDLKFTATMFLPTGHIGDDAMTFKGNTCLTWREIKELQRNGFVFGSHTVTHPKLYELGRDQIREELTISRDTIQQRLGSAVDSFAYPYAFPEFDRGFKQSFRGLLQECGYTHGVCTTLGRVTASSDIYFLERLPVNSLDDNDFLFAKLEGAYDWARRPQLVVKTVKNWVKGGSS